MTVSDKVLLWDLTFACNLKCTHCYNRTKMDSDFNELSFTDIKPHFDKFADLGIDHFHLLGGEPLLYPDFIELANYIKHRRKYLSVNTNGILLSSAVIREAVLHCSNEVTISLDGFSSETNDPTRGEGSFSQICRNVKLLIQQRGDKRTPIISIAYVIPVSVQYTDLLSLLHLCSSIQIDNLMLLSLFDCGAASRLECDYYSYYRDMIYSLARFFQELAIEKSLKTKIILDAKPTTLGLVSNLSGISIENLGGSGCKAGSSIMYMNPSGDISPCGVLSQPKFASLLQKNQIQFAEQNIQDMSATWAHSPIFETFNAQGLTAVKITGVCTECGYTDLCSGECPIMEGETTECSIALLLESEIFKNYSNSQYTIPDCLLLSDTALNIADLFNNGLCFNDVCRCISQDYDTNIKLVMRDVLFFINQLKLSNSIQERRGIHEEIIRKTDSP